MAEKTPAVRLMTTTRHPAVLPNADGVRFVSFLRRLPDGSMKHAPCDFPVEQMVTWQQIVDLWGGGEYQAIAKDAQHRVLRHYPPGGKWMSFAGEPKPLVRPQLARRAVAVDDARASILPAGVPQLPDRGLVRDIELGERVGLANPFDIRPRIACMVRQGILPKTGVVQAADGEHLLSREAAVLVTMRLKLKRRVQLEVVAALLVGAPHPHPVPLALAPDMPPAGAAPPIVMNGEGATATFEGHTIRVYVFRGRPVVVAGDLGRALGYADKGLVKSIAEWTEFNAGRDFDVIEGKDLRQFKAQMRLVPGSGTSRAPNLTLLYETGMDLACQKAQTEAGARLRRYLADHVLPKLRRGEPVTAGGTKVPLVPARPPATSSLAPTSSRADDTPKFHPVLVDRLDETSGRLTVLENQGRELEARLARLEGRPPWPA